MIDLTPSPWIPSRQGRGILKLFNAIPWLLGIFANFLTKTERNNGLSNSSLFLLSREGIKGEGDQKKILIL